MRVLLDSASPMQKRIVAYLVLMKDPKPAELAQLAALLQKEEDQQVRSFMVSHIVNILSSTEPETAEYVKKKKKTVAAAYLFPGISCFTAQCNFIFAPPRLRLMIRDAVQDNKIGNIMDPTRFSRNYKMGSVEGNVIFEGNSYLPKEAMLEMTLRAFGYDIDMMEVNIVSSLSCVFIYFFEVVILKKIFVTSTDWYGGHRI